MGSNGGAQHWTTRTFPLGLPFVLLPSLPLIYHHFLSFTITSSLFSYKCEKGDALRRFSFFNGFINQPQSSIPLSLGISFLLGSLGSDSGQVLNHWLWLHGVRRHSYTAVLNCTNTARIPWLDVKLHVASFVAHLQCVSSFFTHMTLLLLLFCWSLYAKVIRRHLSARHGIAIS